MDAAVASKFLSCSRKHLLRLSDRRLIPAHPLPDRHSVGHGVTCSANFALGCSLTTPSVVLAKLNPKAIQCRPAAPAKEAVNGIPAGEFEEVKRKKE